MARNQQWHDDYWLLLMQAYLSKPTGLKPVYCRRMVNLSMELHIAPQLLHDRMKQIALLSTPRIKRIWREYSNNPRKLNRAAQLLRQMNGFGMADDFYNGVDIQETFESDFRPISPDTQFTPVMLTLILNLYFQLTPLTMVAETPEVQALARLLRQPVADVVEVLDIFQHCDPYLNRNEVMFSTLFPACQSVWQRFACGAPEQLEAYARQLEEYFR